MPNRSGSTGPVPRRSPDDGVVPAGERGKASGLGEVVLVHVQLVGVHGADQQGEVVGGHQAERCVAGERLDVVGHR